jgi:hypothetical protein
MIRIDHDSPNDAENDGKALIIGEVGVPLIKARRKSNMEKIETGGSSPTPLAI